MKRVPHKVEVSEVTFKRLMSEFLETTHSTINYGNKQLKKLIFMRMNETADDAKDRKKRMAEITNKVDDMVKTLGMSTWSLRYCHSHRSNEDFPDGRGAPTQKVGEGRQPIIWPIFGENCMKGKEIGPRAHAP